MNIKIEEKLNSFNWDLREKEEEKNDRDKNQKEAYWCTEKRFYPELYASKPQQRLMARLIRSYQNTTWHKVQLSKLKPVIDSWFETEVIITGALDKWLKQVPETEKEKDEFCKFCTEALNIINRLDNLTEDPFEKEQKGNFTKLSKVVEQRFEEKQEEIEKSQKGSGFEVGEQSFGEKQKKIAKSQKVSAFEKLLFKNLDEPYRTIMKMQKLLPGLGVALTCDFLKEAHLCNIAKPDVHLCHAFSLKDRIPYSMDLALVKRVKEFADQVCPADPDNFCNSGSYFVDKIIWMRLNKGINQE